MRDHVCTFHEQIHTRASWVMQACDRLGTISQSDKYLDRRYLSKEHKAANELVASWMQEVNMKTWQDSVGNVWGRWESDAEDAKSIVMGSHLDTVVNGGKYDGMLGVIAPIALIGLLNTMQCKLPFHIDIVGFCDEEGVRFGTTLLGSRALTGKWKPEWAELEDENGVSMRQAMEEFGLDFDQVSDSKLTPENLLAFVETHIEQGPVLEQRDLPVGVVKAIAGAKRLLVSVEGMAGHAGTVPMATRLDALVGASEMILAIEKLAKIYNVLATVGQISNGPNAINVIPGKTEFTVDIRSDSDELRDICLENMLVRISHIASSRQLNANVSLTHEASAVMCSKVISEQLCQATVNNQISPVNEAYELLSGAGHDTMAMAEICDAGMLFVRCDKGISHHPDESIIVDDVKSVLSVLYEFVTRFDSNWAG